MAITSSMDSSKECCTAHTLDDTEDQSMRKYLKKDSLKKKKRLLRDFTGGLGQWLRFCAPMQGA